jgi:sensor histidine kinase YesM
MTDVDIIETSHRRKWLHECRDVLGLIVLGFLMTWFGLSCHNCREDTKMFLIIGSFTSLLWVGLWKGNDYLAEYLSLKISWIRFPLKRFIVGIIVTILYSLIFVYAISFVYRWSFGLEINLSVLISVAFTFAISLFMHGRGFLLNWRKTAIEAERYQRESITAQYESLKNQVNPHFLFNSLNALSNLVYEDQEKAVQFLRELSKVYRYVLETREHEVVPIDQELEFLKAFLFLQQIRFGEKLQVEFGVTTSDYSIPPLALQMLAENSTKHNIVSEDDPLTIRIFEENEFVCVENNLQVRRTIGEPSTGVGLENIKRRYAALSSRNLEVMNNGVTFLVKLPKIKISSQLK